MFKSLVVSFLLTGCLGASANTVNVPSVDNYIPQTDQVQIFQGVRNGKPIDLNYITFSNNTVQDKKVENNQLIVTYTFDCNIGFQSNLSLDSGNNIIYVSYDLINAYYTYTPSQFTSVYYSVTVGTDTGVSNYETSLGTLTESTVGHKSFTYTNSQSVNTNFIDAVIINISSQSSSLCDIVVSNVQVYNLTTIFGSGNEPSKTAFEEIIGNQYYDYGSYILRLYEYEPQDRLFGLYNFKDEVIFDISDFDYAEPNDPLSHIIFENVDDGYIKSTPFLLNGQTCFLRSIDLKLVSTPSGPMLAFTFNYYNYVASDFTKNLLISSGFRLADLSSSDVSDYGSMIIKISNVLFIDKRASQIFNTVFTRDDNIYVTSYSGYYNMSSSSISSSTSFNVFGSFTFNNYLYSGLTNNLNGISTNYLYFAIWGYDWEDTLNNQTVSIPGSMYDIYDFPFKSSVVDNNNFQFTGVKMSVEDYNDLSNIGVFAYVRDTSYDNATFSDLLFALMDSPIYMISRLFSFELFGVNLFMALTGLLTIAVILGILRWKI